jgi:hypothetical protein
MSSPGEVLASIDPGPALKSVGKTIESGVREIGKGAEGLGREVGKVGQAAINDPVGTSLKVAAIVTQQYWALPLISAGTVVANGGSIEQAAISAGISAAAMAVSYGITQGLDTAFANELTSSVGDASLTATNTLADGTIQHVFSDGSTILQGVDGAISTTAATVAPSIASQIPAGMLQSITTALGNAGGSAAMTALRGGDLSDVLLSGVSSGAGSFAGTQTSTQLKDLGLNSKVAEVLGRTTGAVTSGAVQGQDVNQIFGTALVNNIVRTSLSEAGKSLQNTQVARGLTKNLNEAIQPFKDTVNSTKQSFLDQAKKLTDLRTEAEDVGKSAIEKSSAIKTEAETYANNVLNPARENANKVYETTLSSFNEYKAVSERFSDLVKKYDEAKAADNVELANQYADEANALIPSVNAATEKYNADYGAYDVVKNDFETKNQTYAGYVGELKNLNDQYVAAYKAVDDQLAVVNKSADGFNTSVDEMQNTLNTTAKNVEEAYIKASEYDPIAKSTFEKLYGESGDLNRAVNLSQQVNLLQPESQRMYEFSTNFGLRPEDAIQFAPDVSKMSLVAAQTFYDSLSQNPDAASAFNTAKQINSFDDSKQDSFYNAKLKGLDTEQAIDVANTVAGASKEQQDIYIDTVKYGLGSDLASIFSAAQSLVGPGTQLQDIGDANLAQLKTEEGKNAYRYYTYGGVDNAQALAMAKGEDDAALARRTGTQSAGTGGAYLPPGQTGVSAGSVTVTNPPPGFNAPGGPGVSAQEIETLNAKLESGQITEEEYNQQYKQLFQQPEQPTPTPAPEKTDYYQSLIDRIFTDKNVKAKTLATTPPAPGGGAQTVTVPGGGAQTGTAPGGIGGGTTTVGGTTTGPATPGGAVTGGTGTGGSGGTEPGTGSGGGTGTVPGGGGTGNIGFGIGGIGGGGFTIPGGMYGMYGMTGQDQFGGIKNLTAGLTERANYELSGLSSDEDKENPMYNAPQMIPQMAIGGSSTLGSSNYDPFSTTDTTGKSSISSSLTPSLTKAQLNYILTGLPNYLQGKADGGHIEGHNPQFYSEGGLNSLENRYVKGAGDGTSDDVPAMLANGEFVIPADVVSKLGNGSNDAGANILDEFLQVIREHAQRHDPKELPPDSKGALAYLEEAQQRAEA